MIITLINKIINIDKGKIAWISDDILNILYENDMFSYEYKEYKITINYHEYYLLCPQLKLPSVRLPVIICPSLIIPRKKYPVYVYLYAVALYLTSNLSMRKVAIEVKKKFGLETFSHSTLSRTLKKLKKNIEILFPLISTQKHITVNPHYCLCKDLSHQIVCKLISILQPILKDFKSYCSNLIYDCFFKSGGKYLF